MESTTDGRPATSNHSDNAFLLSLVGGTHGTLLLLLLLLLTPHLSPLTPHLPACPALPSSPAPSPPLPSLTARQRGKWDVRAFSTIPGVFLMQQPSDFACALLVQDACYLFMRGMASPLCMV